MPHHASTPCCSRGGGHNLHGAACSWFSPSCHREVSSQAIASFSCSLRVCGAAGGTRIHSHLWKVGFCLEIMEQQLCGTSLALLLCLQSKFHSLDVLAVALGHGGAKGSWSSQPGKPCLLLPDKQRGSCALAIKSWQHPPVTRSYSVGRKLLRMMQTQHPRGWHRTCLSPAFCTSPSPPFSCEDDG